MPPVTVSVAMATFQGARYLREQLDSIAGQTRPPDELVVSDDASTDATMAILARFAETAPFPVRVHRNPRSLGHPRNFETALSRCCGDHLVLSDQDDLWEPNKIESILEVLRQPRYDFVLSDARILTESGRDTGKTLWKLQRFGADQTRAFTRPEDQFRLLFRYRITAGMATAFTRRVVEIAGPLPGKVSHDLWYVPVAAAAGLTGALIEQPLVGYRQHAGQAFGARSTGLVPRLWRTLREGGFRPIDTTVPELWLRRLKEFQGNSAAAASVLLIEEITRHMWLRQRLRQEPQFQRIPFVGRELTSGRYARFSNGLNSAMVDLTSGPSPRQPGSIPDSGARQSGG